MNFAEVYSRASRFTIVNEVRCRSLFSLAQRTVRIKGEVAELGVFRGGTTMLLAEVLRGKDIHAFDTFSGMPDTTLPVDVHRAGDFADTSLTAVSRRLSKYRNVRLHSGLFPQSAEECVNLRFCFAHFDGDIYQSCKDFIAFFWSRMSVGGILVFDDWEWPNCPGVKEAVMEAGLDVVRAAPFQCYVIKH